MKKEYESPEIEFVSFVLDGVLSEVIHSSFERGGGNLDWSFNDGDDDDFGTELTLP